MYCMYMSYVMYHLYGVYASVYISTYMHNIFMYCIYSMPCIYGMYCMYLTVYKLYKIDMHTHTYTYTHTTYFISICVHWITVLLVTFAPSNEERTVNDPCRCHHTGSHIPCDSFYSPSESVIMVSPLMSEILIEQEPLVGHTSP
jgi:hypothetical protein